MSENQNHEAPKVFRIASWAMAVVGAFVFSSAVGLLAYSMVQNPISAQTDQTKDDPAASPNDNEIAILNNFPQNPADSAYKGGIIYDKLDDPNGAKWNCLAVPIAGYDKSKNWQENQKIVTEYLQDKLVNGKKIQIFNTYEDFNKAYQAGTLTQADMANTVILSSLDIPAVRDETKDAKTGKKTKCEGTSDPYSLADQGGEKIVPASENNTYQEYLEAQKKQQSEANAQPLPQPAFGTGAEGAVQVPIGADSTGESSEPPAKKKVAETNNEYNDKAAACLLEVSDRIDKIPPPFTRVIFSARLQVINGYWKNRKTQFDKCQDLLAKIKAEYPETEASPSTSTPFTQETNPFITNLPKVELTISGATNRPGKGNVMVYLFTYTSEGKSGKSCKDNRNNVDSRTYSLTNDTVASYKTNDDTAKILFIYTPVRGWIKEKLRINEPAYNYKEFDISDYYEGNKGVKININYSPQYETGNGAQFNNLISLYNCSP